MITEPANPYAAPKVDVNAGLAGLVPEDLPTAGMGARFLNFLIDSVVRMVFATIVSVVIRLAAGAGDAAATLGVLFMLATIMGYYLILEALFGWTIGKLVTGTRVVTFRGGKPSFWQILGRSFARFIPFEPFSLLFSSSNQGWHDSLSGTRVVRVRR